MYTQIYICFCSKLNSDIEGEWAPNSGDRVSFKKILIPPKLLKYQAVHVKLIHLNQNVPHQHWEDTRQNL
jgi:hypothetical protein